MKTDRHARAFFSLGKQNQFEGSALSPRVDLYTDIMYTNASIFNIHYCRDIEECVKRLAEQIFSTCAFL